MFPKPILYSDACKHNFHAWMPNGVRQGVPDILFKIPSKNPDMSNIDFVNKNL